MVEQRNSEKAKGVVLVAVDDFETALRPIIREALIELYGSNYVDEENKRRVLCGEREAPANFEKWELRHLVYAILGRWRGRSASGAESSFESFFSRKFSVGNLPKLKDDFKRSKDLRNQAAHERDFSEDDASDFLRTAVRVLEILGIDDTADKFRARTVSLKSIEAASPMLKGAEQGNNDLTSTAAAKAEQNKKSLIEHSDNSANANRSEAREILYFKMNRRSELARASKSYFQYVDELRDFPLVGRNEWLPRSLLPLDAVELQWLGRNPEDVDPIRLALFDGQRCSAWSKLLDSEMVLNPGYSYRLRDVEVDADRTRYTLMFQGSDYLSYYDTCEALAFEVAEWCKRNAGRMPSYDRNDLPFHGSPDRVFDLSSRNAVAGQSALLIFFNGPGGDQFFLHDRSASKLAEAQNTYHVVPAGSFQPDSYADARHGGEFSLKRAIWREFSEELLGMEELQKFAMYGEDFSDNKKVMKFIDGERAGFVRLFFLGVGFDPTTTKPEVLLCIAINADALGIRDYTTLFRPSWEGTHFAVPWSKEKLTEFAKDPKTLAAGSACLDRAAYHFEALNNVFRG